MTSKLLQVIGVGLAATATSALAGNFSTDPLPPASGGSEGGSGDWCETLQDIGTVYKDKKNPWLQEVKFFGRAHYQVGYVDGDVAGNNFSGEGDELRRLRFGASIKFLNGFKLTGRVNLSRGGFRDTHVGYDNWDELILEYDAGDLGAFEDVTIGYGRYKPGFGGEEEMSSKKIKTIERSNLNNYYAGGRPTGAKLGFELGKVGYSLGVFSTAGTDGHAPVIGGWKGATAYMLSADFEALGGDVLLQALYNDASAAEDTVFGYHWAVSATHDTKFGPFDLLTNLTYGEDHNGDAAYGVVIMPSIDLIEDKLEAVVRYQYFKGDGNIALTGTKRILERVANKNGVIDPSGDENHTIYAGLNYYFCDHNLKLMTGVEYETIDGGTADSESTTVWGAVRFFF
jgi:hypothetical protein